jgi:hypothetical protein
LLKKISESLLTRVEENCENGSTPIHYSKEPLKMKTKTLLPSCLDSRLAAYAAVATAALAAPALPTADANIVYSGVLNTSIPLTFDGLYLNMVTGAAVTTAGTTLPGWDVNPWATAGAWRFNVNANGANADGGVVGTGTAVTNLTLGTIIGAASTFITGASNIPPNGVSIFGIRLFNEATSTTHFGWLRVNLPTGGGAGTLVDFAFENVANTSIGAGAIPEPSTVTLLGVMAAGAIGVRAWRKRKAA